MQAQKSQTIVGRDLKRALLAVILMLGSSCGGTGSGSSSQPVCDGSRDAGGVSVIVTPCESAVDIPDDCPMALICQITVSNNNAEDIDVSMVSGSASVAPLDFTVLQGKPKTVDVFYACGADIDESGRMEIDVSLVGGPGAFCGRDVDWSVDVTLVP
jgi:hypothetical protein